MLTVLTGHLHFLWFRPNFKMPLLKEVRGSETGWCVRRQEEAVIRRQRRV